MKKAVKDVVVLKDNITVDGASLDEIVRWWKAKEEADASVNPTCHFAVIFIFWIQQKKGV